jgi:hypothetical protein
MTDLAVHPILDVIGDYNEFLTILIERCNEIGIDLTPFEIDHICFRCSRLSEYVQKKEVISSLGGCSLLTEGMIGGRPITVYEFEVPIVFKTWNIRCLELASPKMGRLHRNGLEHIEVVVGHDTNEMFNSQTLLEAFASNFPTVQFDRKGMHKDVNADICVNLGQDIFIKFHARPLYEVCHHEVTNGLVVPIPEGYFD